MRCLPWEGEKVHTQNWVLALGGPPPQMCDCGHEPLTTPDLFSHLLKERAR